MQRLPDAGRFFFAAYLFLFGLQCLLYRSFINTTPVPAWVPAQPLLAALIGAAIILAALALLVAGLRQRAATLLAGFFLFVLLGLHLPLLLRSPRDGGEWTVFLETLAFFGGGLLLRGKSGARLGQLCFAVSLFGFAMLHFVYPRFIATLIPAFFPGRLFLAWFVGFAFLAAGLGLLTRVQARLAAGLLALMFCLWFVVLHAPRVLASPGNRDEWSSAFIALAMGGLALVQTARPALGTGQR